MNTQRPTRSKPEFKLQNAILLMALAAAYPVSGQAAGIAGITQFAVGEVNVRRADGRTDTLVKGKDIGSGEAIVTGPTGRAQVKFTDGGLVSLQPNTEFKVSNYVDQSDPKEDRFLVDLLRGSMRAITGLIGKRNRENYKVMTSTATIGIRGSGFNAGYNPDGTLGVTTEFDGIEVCNAAGCVGLTAGESVVVVNNTTLPVRTNTRADVPTPETKQDAVVAGNQTSDSGTSAVVPSAPAPTPAPQTAKTPSPAPAPTPAPAPAAVTRRLLTGIAFVSVGINSQDYDRRSSVNGTLVLGDGSNAANIGQPTSYISDASSVGTGTSTGERTVVATSGSQQTGGYWVLGTWAGANWTKPDASTTPVGPTAFVAGTPSPDAAVFALSGMRASYALQSATPVFSSLGGTGTLLPSSQINVDFSGAGSYADVNLDVSFASLGSTNTTNVTNNAQPIVFATVIPSAPTYNLRGGISSTGNGLKGNVVVSGTACDSPSNYCGSGTVTGGFSGANAQNALLSFGAISQANGVFGGAAIFTSGSPKATPSNNTLTDLTVGFADGGAVLKGYSYASDLYSTVTPSFYGENLISVSNDSPYGGLTTIQNTNRASGSFGAVGVISDADFLSWGNWVAGSKTDTPYAYGSSTSTMLNSVHYIVGRPTPGVQMPSSGTAAFALIGGTVPTATLNGATISGQLMSANLAVDFSQGLVNSTISTKFGAVTVNIDDHAYISLGNANFSGPSVSGFFTGRNAARAGLVYSSNANPALGNVTGAAAFQRSTFTPGTINTGGTGG